MNRKTKGALAAGAGAILLLGGAGSYALWSDDEDVAGGNITTGDFGLACTTGTWTDLSPTMNGSSTVNPATHLMVPGDTWQYAADCTVTATGKNMEAELSVSGVGTSTPSQYITINASVDGGAVNTPVAVSNGEVLPVTVTVIFDHDTPNLEFTDSQVSVANMKINLNQVRP